MALLALAQAVNLGWVLLATRLYGPDAFGRYATLFAVAAVVGGASALRLDVAATTATDRDAVVLLRTAVRFNLAGAALLAVGAAVLGGATGWITPLEVLTLGASTAALGLATTMVFARTRDRRYTLVAGGKLVSAVVCVVVQIALAPVALTASTLLASVAAGYTASALLLCRVRPSPPSETLPGTRRVLGRHRAFLVASAPANLVGAVASNLPVLVVGTALGGAAAADVALALRVGQLPSALFGQALMPMLFGEIAYQLRSSPATAARSYGRALVRLAVVGLLSLTALALGAWAVAPTVLGAEWTGAGVALLLLVPALAAQFAVTPLSLTLNATGRTGQQLAWDVLRLVATGVVFLPGVLGWLGLSACLALYSAVTVLVYGVHVLLVRAALGAHLPAEPTTDAMPPERAGREHVPA
ncbi:oligosaccharide flippase family protein [Micromonospora echinospora]|uniref:oligosaccharide flippase family protein n=1 Tax=Micromonospora echinospora TaxID=1877 RepID=UPI003794962D